MNLINIQVKAWIRKGSCWAKEHYNFGTNRIKPSISFNILRLQHLLVYLLETNKIQKKNSYKKLSQNSFVIFTDFYYIPNRCIFYIQRPRT
ncbi:hypothetical protein pb186bvf_008056 [Paramecium bursaria]